MSVRHPLRRPDIDFRQLRDELSSRIGRRVEVVAQPPLDVDDPDGVLIVEDANSGGWLDIDPAIVAEIVAEHVPPDRRSPEEIAIEEFDAAPTVAGKLQAWRAHLGRQVARQRAARDRARREAAEMARRERAGRDR